MGRVCSCSSQMCELFGCQQEARGRAQPHFLHGAQARIDALTAGWTAANVESLAKTVRIGELTAERDAALAELASLKRSAS